LDCEPAESEFGKGLLENIEYFRLDFLNPDEVARGDAFQSILPILWMMAGCRGKREDSKGSQSWFFPKRAPFAVLIKEKEFRAFREALVERKDIGWVYLVTDSEENFGLMRRALGRKFHSMQLYKKLSGKFSHQHTRSARRMGCSMKLDLKSFQETGARDIISELDDCPCGRRKR